MPHVRFSVLDRSRIRRGQDPGQALRDTVDFAREAEGLGFHRFWVSEHHGVPGVAGSAPTVLAAAVAAATSRIRVGTGGVMLPNHRPMVVAEQFGVLESLFPGRVDMGLGRSVGFTDGVRRALGRDKDAMEDFGALLAELLGYFTGDGAVRAWPATGLRVPAFVLATGAGADVAAEYGLPLVIAAVRGEERSEMGVLPQPGGWVGVPPAKRGGVPPPADGWGRMLEAIGRYREGFRPSVWATEPYVVVSAAVAVAGTTEAARELLVPEAWAAAWSRTHGTFPPLMPAEEIAALNMTPRERTHFDQALRGHVHGTEREVAQALAGLVERSRADEVLVATSTFDRAAMSDSYRRLAGLAGLG